jgi:hypothetical protein
MTRSSVLLVHEIRFRNKPVIRTLYFFNSYIVKRGTIHFGMSLGGTTGWAKSFATFLVFHISRARRMIERWSFSQKMRLGKCNGKCNRLNYIVDVVAAVTGSLGCYALSVSALIHALFRYGLNMILFQEYLYYNTITHTVTPPHVLFLYQRYHLRSL